MSCDGHECDTELNSWSHRRTIPLIKVESRAMVIGFAMEITVWLFVASY